MLQHWFSEAFMLLKNVVNAFIHEKPKMDNTFCFEGDKGGCTFSSHNSLFDTSASAAGTHFA